MTAVEERPAVDDEVADFKAEVGEFIGWHIQHYREIRGLPQQGLADLIGSSRTAVAAWESGKNTPSSVTLVLVAWALLVEPAALLPREGA